MVRKFYISQKQYKKIDAISQLIFPTGYSANQKKWAQNRRGSRALIRNAAQGGEVSTILRMVDESTILLNQMATGPSSISAEIA
jgi:hypothetical protein